MSKFLEICNKYKLDLNRFSRDYYENKLIKGEKPNKDDLNYVFIESNLSLIECTEVFNIGYSSLRENLRFYKIFKDPKLQQRNREKKCLQKYGVENTSQLPEIKEKIKKTNQKKYGGNAPACNKEILEKIKKTNNEKYGCNWNWQTEEGKQKQIDSILKKYGVKNIMQLESTKKKAKQTKIE